MTSIGCQVACKVYIATAQGFAMHIVAGRVVTSPLGLTYPGCSAFPTCSALWQRLITSGKASRQAILIVLAIWTILAFFPNRGGTTIRVLIEIERGTETHTKRDRTFVLAPRRSQRLFENYSGFTTKVQTDVAIYKRQQFATVRIRVWRLLAYFTLFLCVCDSFQFFFVRWLSSRNRINESNPSTESLHLK